MHRHPFRARRTLAPAPFALASSVLASFALASSALAASFSAASAAAPQSVGPWSIDHSFTVSSFGAVPFIGDPVVDRSSGPTPFGPLSPTVPVPRDPLGHVATATPVAGFPAARPSNAPVLDG